MLQKSKSDSPILPVFLQRKTDSRISFQVLVAGSVISSCKASYGMNKTREEAWFSAIGILWAEELGEGFFRDLGLLAAASGCCCWGSEKVRKRVFKGGRRVRRRIFQRPEVLSGTKKCWGSEKVKTRVFKRGP